MSETGIPVSSIDHLLLPHLVHTGLMVHLLQCAPNEGVGMLGVHEPEPTENGLQATAALFVPGRNIEQSPVRFTMHPHDVVMAFRQFRDQGLHLGAIVHSHLRGPAAPSESDIREWNYPEALMVIVSFADHPPTLAAWRLTTEEERAHPAHVPITLLPAPSATEQSSGET